MITVFLHMFDRALGFIEYQLKRAHVYIRGGSLTVYNPTHSLLSHVEMGVKSQLVIGKGFGVREGARILVRDGAILNIGTNVFLNYGVIITSRQSIKVGDGSIFGPNVMVFDHDHDYHSIDYRDRYITSPITIDDGCWIGANSIVCKGVHLASGSVIGANSICLSSTTPYTVSFGSPAMIHHSYIRN